MQEGERSELGSGRVNRCKRVVVVVRGGGWCGRVQVRPQRAGDTCRSDVRQPAMDHAVPDALDCDAVAVVFESVK